MKRNDPHPSPKRFWTAKEAAAYVGVHVRTLYDWCNFKPGKTTGQRISIPPFRRLGRNLLRFPIDEFKEWADRFDSPQQERP